MTKKIKILQVLYLLNDLLLLPHIWIEFGILTGNASMVPEQNPVFQAVFIVTIFLRCFLLPYIWSAVITVLYLVLLCKSKFVVKDTVIFGILFVVCVLGLIALESHFQGALGI